VDNIRVFQVAGIRVKGMSTNKFLKKKKKRKKEKEGGYCKMSSSWNMLFIVTESLVITDLMATSLPS